MSVSSWRLKTGQHFPFIVFRGEAAPLSLSVLLVEGSGVGGTMGRRSSSATLAWEDVLGSRVRQILAFKMWDTCWVLALV